MKQSILTFIHLSDIHFQCWSDGRYDEDKDLRNELILDASDLVKELNPPDGILITGDVAFRGSEKEYSIAKRWLNELCTKVHRSFAHVLCVPGNHDVYRDCITKSPLLETTHRELREVEPENLDAKIRSYFNDGFAREIIFEPITEYNKFAGSFACQMNADQPTWQRDLELNDGSILRINGLNSTFVSNKFDNNYKKVVLGRFQIPQREPGVAHMIMCHHPPSWWRDLEKVGQDMDSRTRIELFGHKHSHKLGIKNNALRVAAGAVQPDRRDPDWRPRYNWLTVGVSSEEDSRILNVRVYPRIWSDSEPKFIPDKNSCNGNDHRHYPLGLESWTGPVEREPSTGSRVADVIYRVETTSTSNDEERTMDGARILTYRFFDLPHVVRLDIARELDLLRDEDEGLQDFELFGSVIQRAVDSNILEQLWDRVEERHNDNKYPTNPFRNK